MSHRRLYDAWNKTASASILGVTLGGHHLFLDAVDDFYRHFHRHRDQDSAVDGEAIGIIQLGAAAKISFQPSIVRVYPRWKLRGHFSTRLS